MDKVTLDTIRLKQIILNTFKNTNELGGGKEYRYYHCVNVTETAIKIAIKEDLNINFDVLYLSALFHDIKKVHAVNENGHLDYESEANKNHDLVEADYLKNILSGFDIDENIITETAKVITSKEYDPNYSLETKVLIDADELGNFGYLQVWRTFSYSAQDGVNILDAIERWSREIRDSRINLIKKLNFDSSKNLANRRFAKTDDFMKEIRRELEVLDFDD